eukprot:c17735_g1_i2 orf=374-1090(+)
MIALLTSIVVMEGCIVILLMIHLTVIQRPLMKGLEVLRTGKGAATVKTVFGSVFIVLAATINSICKIERRTMELGSSTPTDQYVQCNHLLEASLLGYTLFLGLVINRLHHYLQQIVSLRINLETLNKQAKASETEYLRLKALHTSQERVENNYGSSKEIESLKGVISDLRQKVEELQLDLQEKNQAAEAAEANARALQKQSEVFLLEYDRLLEDNQHLRSQLVSLDRRLSHSDSGRNM